jgi:hypothetical protein
LILNRLYLVALLLLVKSVWAKDIYYNKLNNLNGLPSNKVFDIYQDSKGFIWLGTEAGLIRFDSKNYKKYFAANQSSLPGSNIKEDVYNRIWYMNFDGFLFYIENDTIKALNNKTSNSFHPFTMTKQYIFVLQKQGFDVYDLKTLQVVKHIPFNMSQTESTIANIQENVYFLKNKTLFQIDKNLNLIEQKNSFKPNFTNGKLTTYQDKIYWASQFNFEKTIYVYNQHLEYLSEIKIPQVESINDLNFVENQLWVNTNYGSFIYEFINGTLSLRDHVLKNYSISKCIKDYQNNYWVSTLNDGIINIADLKTNVINIQQYHPSVFDYYRGEYIVGTKLGQILKIKNNQVQASIALKSNPLVYYLKVNQKSGDIISSSLGSQLFKNSQLRTFETVPFAIKDVCDIDQKYYAFSGSGQIILYKRFENLKKSSVWDQFFNQSKDKKSNIYFLETDIRANCIVYDSLSKTIFYSGNTGLNFTKTNERGSIKDEKGQLFFARKLYFFNHQLYALSTKGDLYKISKNNQHYQFQNLHKTLKLEANSIKHIKIHQNNMYLMTDNSLLKYGLNNNEISRVPLLVSYNEINDFIVINDSLIALLTNHYIIEKKIKNNEKTKFASPKFHILSLIANGRYLNYKNEQKLKYEDNPIVIEFADLNFNLDEEHLLQYQFNNNAWTTINKSEPALVFQNLKEGNYQLKFRSDGYIHKEIIQFTIYAPFYRTMWFYFLILIIISVIILIIFRLRLKNIQKEVSFITEKMSLEKELNKSILTSIKAQMNPHFFYNALNTIQSFLYTDKKRDASNYLSKFSDLTRMILEMSDKESIKLHEEIEAIKLYLELEKMRFENDFVFHLNISSDVDLEMINIPSMLIQPYIENAIKHGLLHKEGDKNLFISFNRIGNDLQVMIEDNGVGRKQSQKLKNFRNINHQSYATKANQKRLELINKYNKNVKPVEIIDLYNQNEEGIGTKVILHIPIQ